jgi:photosystem II stability/assembly factor-like uncharacterized protein
VIKRATWFPTLLAGTCLWLTLLAAAWSQALKAEWELGPTGVQASLRGLSAASDDILWAAGSAATVIRSSDGGSSWESCGPADFPDLEFRSIHAWSATEACIASAGTPAMILLTKDAGTTWVEVFKSESAAAFFDGLQFWDAEHGIAFSDPVDGHLLVVETSDRGRTWVQVPAKELPPSLTGEAGFAASNSSICVGETGAVWIGTGGVESPQSRIHLRKSWKAGWQIAACPLPSAAAEGIFSIAHGGDALVAVGGDYRPEASSKLTAALSRDAGMTWIPAKRPPAAFRSAVVYLPTRGVFLCVGPTGTDFSADGLTWQSLATADATSEGFHALSVGMRRVFAVGANGKFGKLEL